MNRLYIIGSLLLSFFIWQGCTLGSNDSDQVLIGQNRSLKPIYLDSDDWQAIEATTPQPIRKLGKIYYKTPYIYVNEQHAGIHVFDNTDPSNPIALKFIEIPGNTDISIKGNYLYANNVGDLVVLNIADFDNIYVENRVTGLYPESQSQHPLGYRGFFECPDENRVVIGWEEAELENPKCWK